VFARVYNYMSRRPFMRAVALLAGMTFGLLAQPALADDPAFLAFGAGYFDINDDKDAAEFRIEYRGSNRFWLFKPIIGGMATSDAAIYGYAGVNVDLFFGRRFVLTPNFAAGLYHDGDGKDLGHVVEFRSGAEIAYRFDNRSRLGVALHHISNASLDDNNPGTEILALVYSLPLGD
jgi:lipid A 3-O-deacylase